ncbi:cysteine--tRNA ligase [Methylibium sp.]|uniref:cysteine--tRNA ligase n=1 Tax=Methylibium sp. TaxID=2067992 RepID=UPI003D13E689
MSLRIHNTLTRSTEAFSPIEPGHVRMYVCGMTIYDLCHVGHARMMMAFDVVQRWLRVSGLRVTYVRNITDIDDKIIKRALERGIPIRQLTDEMTAAMHQDIGALGIEPPTHEPRATEYVGAMVGLIEMLERNGLAYRVPSGDVNYSVRKFPGYGRLSGKSIDALRAGERVAVLEGKDDPLDFVLWKSAKSEEPADAKYDAPFGAGRPGWHIECSAMAHALLGERFDIHGGGMDLQFPHHENEIAQSDGAFHLGSGHSFVNVWMHNGFLNVDNEKMSKSLGNFFTIRDVLKSYDGETIRFFMLRVHYRSPFNFSDAGLDDARGGLRRLYTALQGTAVAPAEIDWTDPHAARFKAAMDDDFNTPIAVSVLFDLAGEVNRSRSAQSAGLLRSLAGTLGLLRQEAAQYLQGGSGVDTGYIEAQIAARATAKAARDFAESDRIRDALAAQGIVLKDTPAGTTWVKA